MDSSKFENRNKKFKSSFDIEDIRKRRGEGLIELRKKKRDDHISKKRALISESGKLAQEAIVLTNETVVFKYEWVDSDLIAAEPRLISPEIAPESRLVILLEIILGIEDWTILFKSIQTLRKILSDETPPPLLMITKSGVSRKLIDLISYDLIDLQIECAWCLLNIASGSGEIIEMIAADGVIEALIGLMGNSNYDLADLCIWTLGNIAGDSVRSRDKIIEAGGINKLLEIIKNREGIEIQHLSTLVWTISNLCRGKPSPSHDLMTKVIKIIPDLFATNNEDILSDSCWILSYMSDGYTEHIEELISLNLLPALVELLSNPIVKIQIPALRTLGNILTGNDQQTEKVILLGLIDKIAPLLTSKKRSLRKEALWAISNVMAGTDEQINMVLSHPCMKLVVAAVMDPDIEIKKEALWAISNASHAKNVALIFKVVELGAMTALCEILDMQEAKILLIALEALNNILRAGKDMINFNKCGGVNEIALKFDEMDGVLKLENLQTHPNVKIYQKVVAIMDEHYGLEEIDENTNSEQAPIMFSIA
ncbi:unnamed protein product [Blepharisma stoltei]|uniref:Importin subunit alpha n=1 Tax=Blepharisma stoltei TaxID=1481888 RepID=A0AAU9J4S8_9CILI|nr:unnamed protein product [Blepharisma stoltei]